MDFGYKMAWDLERLEPNTFFPITAAVVFAERTGGVGRVGPLTGQVERWMGSPGEHADRKIVTAITDTVKRGDSPYAGLARKGADIYPRSLLLVEETKNPATLQAGQTITVKPRRGAHEKSPWRDVDLTAITGQTIENRHVFDVHLGETVTPYVTLDPLKAVLPVSTNDGEIPADSNGVGGIRLGGLGRRMRERWETISDIWEENKKSHNKLDLLENLDHYGKLSSQMKWRQDPGKRPVRIAYTASGVPTAALLSDNVIVDHVLYWVPCKDKREAFYLLATINSDTLYQAVKPLMPKGQFGARHLHKHLWKLPIPDFDAGNPLHVEVSEAGEAAAAGAAKQLERLRQERDRVTVTIARRELRKWLRASDEGQAVEDVVGRLLGGG